MATNTRKLAALLGASGAGIADAGTINTAGITADAIDNTKIADNAINDENIAAGQVLADIADGSITSAKLASGTVFNPDVSSPHIIPGVLQPAVDGKLLNGANHSGAYGTAQTQSGGDGHKYYYTNIKGSRPIKDPRIGAHFGSQRHKFKSIQLLEQETATHGIDVYSIDGRENCRAVRNNQVLQNNQQGNYLSQETAGDFIEIIGYFNDINLLFRQSGATQTAQVHVNGVQAHSAFAFTSSVVSPLNSRYVDSCSVRNIDITSSSSLSSDTALGINTIKFTVATPDCFYCCLLYTSDAADE